jgi:hypothetical protein
VESACLQRRFAEVDDVPTRTFRYIDGSEPSVRANQNYSVNKQLEWTRRQESLERFVQAARKVILSPLFSLRVRL